MISWIELELNEPKTVAMAAEAEVTAVNRFDKPVICALAPEVDALDERRFVAMSSAGLEYNPETMRYLGPVKYNGGSRFAYVFELVEAPEKPKGRKNKKEAE
jgi:hypothetical protein